MAPFEEAPTSWVPNAVGIREDPRMARLNRARRRCDEQGPAQDYGRQESQVGAALSGQGISMGAPPPRGGQDGDRQRQREAVVAAREDSLARFMAENGKPGSQSPSSAGMAPAGRCHSRNSGCSVGSGYSGIGGPIVGYGGGEQMAPPPPRRAADAAPWAMHEDCQQAPLPRRAPASSPWATDDGRPPLAPTVPMQRNNGGPFAHAPSPYGGMGGGGLPGAQGHGGVAYGAKAGGRISSNAYASGGNQNCGNVLTDKPTSRVLKPPGGGGSLKIGNW
jgi:hypothetical protein